MSQSLSFFRWGSFLAGASLVVGCSVHIAGSNGDDGRGNQVLNDSITWPSNAYALENPPTDDTIQIPSSPGDEPAAPLMAGGSMAVSVPFNAPGANVVGVGIRFGDSGKIMTIPTSTMGKTSGTLMTNVPVPPAICGMLSKICHDIKCYEFAVTSAGKISRANIMSVALMCGNCSEPSCKDLLPDMCSTPGQMMCSDAIPCPREGSGGTAKACASVSGTCVSGYYLTSGGHRFDCGSCQPPCVEAAQALSTYCGN